LLVSLIVPAPWPSRLALQLALAAFGMAGVVYTLIVIRRARGQSDYQPVFEDWVFHCGLPLAGYVAVLLAASDLHRQPTPCLFVAAAAAILLLFVGIHNAWDTVTYIVVAKWERRQQQPKD